MTPSVAIEILANILLLLGGFLFAADTISSFNQGKSSFTETQVDITPNDMPTLSFCYSTYGPEKVLIVLQILEKQQWSDGWPGDAIQHKSLLELDVATNIGDHRFTLEKIDARYHLPVITPNDSAVLACYKISSSWIHAGSDDLRQLVFEAGFLNIFRSTERNEN